MPFQKPIDDASETTAGPDSARGIPVTTSTIPAPSLLRDGDVAVPVVTAVTARRPCPPLQPGRTRHRAMARRPATDPLAVSRTATSRSAVHPRGRPAPPHPGPAARGAGIASARPAPQVVASLPQQQLRRSTARAVTSAHGGPESSRAGSGHMPGRTRMMWLYTAPARARVAADHGVAPVQARRAAAAATGGARACRLGGRPVRLPQRAVAELRLRLNAALGPGPERQRRARRLPAATGCPGPAGASIGRHAARKRGWSGDISRVQSYTRRRTATLGRAGGRRGPARTAAAATVAVTAVVLVQGARAWRGQPGAVDVRQERAGRRGVSPRRGWRA
jgi:hypothetical protein